MSTKLRQSGCPVSTARVFLSLSLTFLLSSCIDILPATESSGGTSSGQPADFTVQSEQPASQTPEVSGPGENTSVTTPPAPSMPEPLPAVGFLINNGALRTQLSEVTLSLSYLSWGYMKIGVSDTCVDGSWEPFSTTRVVSLSQANRANQITVEFSDFDEDRSDCLKQSIIHDNQGPIILFQKYPLGSLEEASQADLSVQVTDSLTPVKSVHCKLNDIERTCFAGINEVHITSMPVGSYRFVVNATDELGNPSESSVNWEVVSNTRLLSQNVIVHDYKKVDVLFVIDNSGSMAYEQQNMAQRTANFISILRGLDWQIGVTTTDPRDITLGDGRLIPITGATNQYLLNSSMNEVTAQSQLGSTLQRSETGSGSEQGIRSAYRLIERFNANESAPKSFLRQDSQFAVVLISDEDESANTTKNDPKNLIDLIASSFQGQKSFSFNSIITKPSDLACRSTYGAAYGERYQMISELTGGLIGSVCESDYAAQVQGAAEKIRNLLKTITLQCQPLAQYEIKVLLDSVPQTIGFKVEGLNIVFDLALQPGNYQIDYRCLKAL